MIEQSGLLKELYANPHCAFMINHEHKLQDYDPHEGLIFIKLCIKGLVLNYGQRRVFDDWSEEAQDRKVDAYYEALKPHKPRYIAHALAYLLNGKVDDKGYPLTLSELKKLVVSLIPSSESRSDHWQEDKPLTLDDLSKSRRTLVAQRHLLAIKIQQGLAPENEYVKKGEFKSQKQLEDFYRFTSGKMADEHFDVVDHLRGIWKRPDEQDKQALREHLDFTMGSLKDEVA